MTREQFVTHARAQINAAQQILAGHYPIDGGVCSCGRQLSCPVAATCAQRREYFSDKLVLAEPTLLLPAVTP
jgi:hypothetical protein